MWCGVRLYEQKLPKLKAKLPKLLLTRLLQAEAREAAASVSGIVAGTSSALEQARTAPRPTRPAANRERRRAPPETRPPPGSRWGQPYWDGATPMRGGARLVTARCVPLPTRARGASGARAGVAAAAKEPAATTGRLL